MNNKIEVFLLIPVLFFLMIGSSDFAQAQSNSQMEKYWFWQKAAEVNSEPEENSIKAIFSMDITKTNSDFKTLDYIFAFTDTGDFIRAGVMYESTVQSNYLSPAYFFYSDSKIHYFTLHPYQPGTENQISIFNDKGWKIYFHNTESDYFQVFDASWASGDSISYGGMVFSGFSDDINAITSCNHIGVIEDRANQEFVLGKNNDEWRAPEIVRAGYQVNKTTASGNTILYQIHPPKFVEISQNSKGYEITFDCPKTDSNNSKSIIDEIKDTQIPDWVKNSMKWYVEEKISEQEMINAIQYLISESIIKIN